MKNKIISSRMLRVALTIFSILLIGSCDSFNGEKVNPALNPGAGNETIKTINNTIVNKVGKSTANTDLTNGILKKLHNCKYLTIYLNGDIVSNNDFVSFSSLNIDNTPPAGVTASCPLVWIGTSFSAAFDYTWDLLPDETVHSIGTITGTMSSTGLNLNYLTAHLTSDYLTEDMTYYYDLSVRNVPYQFDYKYDEYSPMFSAHGSCVSKYITSFSIRWEYLDVEGATQTYSSILINYKDPNNEPILQITFTGNE